MTETKVAPATLKAVSEYLRKPGETLKDFTAQWQALTDDDKAQIKQGLGDGTLTY